MSSEEYRELAERIRVKRQLPYTVSIEKIDGNTITTHNIWGNTVTYKELKDGDFEILEYSD